MAAEVNPDTGKKVFNFASGISLLFFYAFALQCVALAITVKRPTLEMADRTIDFMSGFAYVVALLAYQILK
jgi:ferrous iron transport protein B